MRCLRLALAMRTVWMVVVAGLWLAPTATAAAAKPADGLLISSAGWHGRAIERPHSSEEALTSAADGTPPGWSAGPVRPGAGFTRASGSARVRDLQRRLRRLGYRTGGVDGLYGPRTRAAVGWFQVKHGLRVDGVASTRTVAHLRERTGAPDRSAPAGDGARDRVSLTPAGRVPSPAPASVAAAVTSRGDGIDAWRILGLAGFLLAFVALGYLAERRFGGALDARRRRDAGPAGVAGTRARVLGYVRLTRGARSASFHAQAAAIEAGCAAHGLELVSLVSDVERDRDDAGEPAGLTFAFEQLGSGAVDGLVVSRRDHLGHPDVALERRLSSVGRDRTAIIVLDQADAAEPALPSGSALQEVLERHVTSMRGDGLSPQAIAVALNAEHVPPPEGSAWEGTGVQAVLRRDATERTHDGEVPDV